MKSETVLQQQHPPTPPNAASELQYGLHHIAQHNYDQEGQYLSRHGSTYGSPMPMMDTQHPRQHFHAQHMDPGHYPDPHGNELGLGIQYDGYGPGPTYYNQEGHYNGSLPHNQSMLSGSPPTPRSATDNSDIGRRTRSGRSIVTPSSPQNSKSIPKPSSKQKKAKGGKGDKPKTPKLTAPLSVLTKDYASIPVRNMEEWVNRSAEVRRKEVEKRNGYVTRPMNSFMLYRSAYAERTKHWCLQNNHQVVSSVSGESWPLEPPEIRDLYNEYAKIERINHQNAHPTYKFSPSKTATPSRKRKGEYSDDDEPSDLEDADWDPPGHRRYNRKPLRRQERDAGYPSSHSTMSTEFFDHNFGPNHGMNKSTWDMTNEGRPMPLPMGHTDLYNQYFQTTVHPHMAMPGIEDVRMRRMDTPSSSMHFTQSHGLLGLPGGHSVDLMQQLHSHTGTPLDDGPQVDPMLLAFDDRIDGPLGHHGDGAPDMKHPSDFRNGHMGMIDRDFDQDSVHSMLATHPPHEDYHPEPWHTDPTIAPMEQGSEFDKWMDDNHAG